jgi:hypothetical protein
LPDDEKHGDPIPEHVAAAEAAELREYVAAAELEELREYVAAAELEDLREYVAAANAAELREYAAAANAAELREYVAAAQERFFDIYSKEGRYPVDWEKTAKSLVDCMMDLQEQNTFTLGVYFEALLDHVTVCPAIMPYTYGFLTVGAVWTLGRRTAMTATIVLIGKVAYIIKKMLDPK